MPVMRSDWSLERKGPVDEARHQERVRDAIAEHLDDIITDESIILGDGHGKIRVPLRALKEYSFRYNPKKAAQVGQGGGKSRPGQVLLREVPEPVSGGGSGKGAQARRAAGQQPGEDTLETEVSLDDLVDMVLSELVLPDLVAKPPGPASSNQPKPRGIAKAGPMSAADIHRSLRANVLRHARAGHAEVGSWSGDDLRFRSYRKRQAPGSAAAVIAMRDASGSMGEFKKYIARSFFFWMFRFLRTQYREVHIAFVTHHVEAKEVDEDAFFRLGESGGTRASSAYQLALDLIRTRFPPDRFNIYAFHFSDGDNWGDADNNLCVVLAQQLLTVASEVGYGEISERGYQSPLMTALRGLSDPRFRTVALHERKDVYRALKTLFSPRPAEP